VVCGEVHDNFSGDIAGQKPIFLAENGMDRGAVEQAEKNNFCFLRRRSRRKDGLGLHPFGFGRCSVVNGERMAAVQNASSNCFAKMPQANES